MSRSRMWCFTVHGTLVELEELLLTIKSPEWGLYGNCQLERCPQTARLHLQGFLVLDRQQRLSFLKKLHPFAHWEPAKGSLEQNEAYCSKEETREEGSIPHQWGERPVNQQGRRNDLEKAVSVLTATQGTVRSRMKRLAEDGLGAVVVKHYKGLEYLARLTECELTVDAPAQWFEWQAKLLQYIEHEQGLPANEQDDRRILWYTDPVGGNGKSTMVRYLVCNAKAVMLSGKVADMAHAYNGEPIALFDVTRTQLEHMDHLYSFAESLKNGMIFSPKYESGMKVFKPPIVIFFANQTYARGKWSEDRAFEINISTQQFSAVSVDYTQTGLPTNVELETAQLLSEAGGH